SARHNSRWQIDCAPPRSMPSPPQEAVGALPRRALPRPSHRRTDTSVEWLDGSRCRILRRIGPSARTFLINEENDMKIVVIGSTRRVRSQTVERLRRKGHEVVEATPGFFGGWMF